MRAVTVGTTFAGFSVNSGNGVLTAWPGRLLMRASSFPLAYVTDSQGRFPPPPSATDSFALSPQLGSADPCQRQSFRVRPDYCHWMACYIRTSSFILWLTASISGSGAYRISGSGSTSTLTPVSSARLSLPVATFPLAVV